MCRSGEEGAVRGNRERGEEEAEDEIQIRILFLLPQLSLYGEMNRLSRGRWLFTALSRFRPGPLEAS
jgi:hypothetical protein